MPDDKEDESDKPSDEKTDNEPGEQDKPSTDTPDEEPDESNKPSMDNSADNTETEGNDTTSDSRKKAVATATAVIGMIALLCAGTAVLAKKRIS